jgi:alpha-L-fucosidase
MKKVVFRFLINSSLVFAIVLSAYQVIAEADTMTAPPAQWGPVPSRGQLDYHKKEMAAFIHFGMNTFTGNEWGTGKESPSQFRLDPAELNPSQWVSVIKAAGFGRLIMVAKHHDGFCNWYSDLTSHDVASAPNPTDVLKKVSEACSAADLDMGVYLSPWDENSAAYGAMVPGTGKIDPWPYNRYYIGQLRELLGNPQYGNNGKFVEFWMDGARAEGYYQPYFFDEKFLKEAKPGVYDDLILTPEQTWFGVIKSYNPEMVVFSPVGSELRWPATEAGKLVMPVWSKIDPMRQRALYIQNGESEAGTSEAYLATGDPNGTQWSIPEADTSILSSGWFEASTPKPVKTLRALGDIYFRSVGRGGVLLLNFAPSRHGELSFAQVNRAEEFGKAIKDTFANNMAMDGTATASSYRGNHEDYSPSNVLDGDYDTYWTMEDGQTTGSITIDLGGAKEFDVVSLQEYIPLGQRVSRYAVEVYSLGNWKAFGNSDDQYTIGYKALIRGGKVTASRVRVTFAQSQAVPVINEIGVYKTSVADFEASSD